ncbi:MAG: hypothetical protein FWE23_10265 [Chitinivibrionia bacterium]|nr:hypothetical protein [Chitinivibrionia bacterium]
MIDKIKLIVILLAIFVSTVFAQRNWGEGSITANDGETIRVSGVFYPGRLTVPEGVTVTIISDGDTPVSRSSTLEIAMGAGSIVRWQARISTSGTANAVTITNAVLWANAGTLEIHDDAIIRQVSSGAGHGIVATAPSTSPTAIRVLGGEVSSIGTGSAIRLTNSATVTVNGGVVSATAGPAIDVLTGTIHITGGLVIAQGTAIFGAFNSIMNPGFDNNVLGQAPSTHTGGLIIAYPQSGSFMPGSRTGLVSLPADANISWGIHNERNGIFYNSGEFFATTGTQQISETINWLGTTVGDGQVIRITATSTGTLNVPAGATVAIISDGEQPISRTAGLNLTIGTGATVRWQARVSTVSVSDALSLGNSGGTLEIHEGAIIRHAGRPAGAANDNTTARHAISLTGTTRITVLGGEVSITGRSGDMAINSTNNNAAITVNGGVVRATAGRALSDNLAAAAIINGGQVSNNPNWLTRSFTAVDGERIRIGAFSFSTGVGQATQVSAAATRGTLTVPQGATITIISDGEQPIARDAVLIGQCCV